MSLSHRKSPIANGSWSVLSDIPASIQTFALYGRRFGGIEPHFKDYKSAAFDVLSSHLRDPQALTCLFMLMDCVTNRSNFRLDACPSRAKKVVGLALSTWLEFSATLFA